MVMNIDIDNARDILSKDPFYFEMNTTPMTTGYEIGRRKIKDHNGLPDIISLHLQGANDNKPGAYLTVEHIPIIAFARGGKGDEDDSVNAILLIRNLFTHVSDYEKDILNTMLSKKQYFEVYNVFEKLGKVNEDPLKVLKLLEFVHAMPDYYADGSYASNIGRYIYNIKTKYKLPMSFRDYAGGFN